MLEARTGHVEKEHLSQEEQPQPVQGQKRHQPGPPRLLPGLRSKPATAARPCKPVRETPRALRDPVRLRSAGP